MSRLISLALVALLFACLPVLAAADLCADPVETESGQVIGLSDLETSTCSWKGIPYAAAPVGELRWAAPQPAPSWSGALEATEFGARCMQKGMMELVNADDSEMSEDCLFLNVWRPKKSGVFPVMFWIHGGGYTGGTGNSEFYLGDRMAESGDVVVVTINYRLNVFGFMAHPSLREEDPNNSTGSYGSLDQVRALQWVQDNIEGFGGDPDNVTIFGESAGGWSVCTMLATPLNEGNFAKAILESGGCEASTDLEAGYGQARDSAKAVGCDFEDVECLRAVPAKKLLKKAAGSQLDGFNWVPRHDGYLLADKPLEMIRDGNYNKVPFMAGSNRDEVDVVLGLLPSVKYGRPKKYGKTIQDLLKTTDEETAELIELYPLSQFDNKVKEGMGQLTTDAGLACPTYNGLAAAAKHQDDVYLYRFDYDEMKMGKRLGAFHAMEIPFVFNSLDRKPVGFLYGEKQMPAAAELSRIVQGYWINFAKTGDPNGEGLPDWPRFDNQSQKVQVLDTTVRTESAGVADRCEFWAEYNEEHGPIFEDLHKFLD